MLHLFFGIKNFVPYDVHKTVFSIDYNKLYEMGKRIILMDIDNTLIPYDIDLPDQKLLELLKNIKKIGFEIIFISNNQKGRVERFARSIDSRYISDALKPLFFSYRKALKMVKPYKKEQIIAIGDQMITDVLGSNLFGIDVILVKAIKRKNEMWFTKFNRKLEEATIKRLERHNKEIFLKIEDMNKNEN